MASKDVALRISKPALLLNRIAQRYSRLSRIIMEYVDNSLDDAEVFFDRERGRYERPISIVVEVNKKPAQVTITDNCRGMTNDTLCRLIQNVGESMKHSKFTNGQFGFGVHAFRAACKQLVVRSRHEEHGDISQIIIDRKSNKFSGCKNAKESGLTHVTGTEVVLKGFDTAWTDGLDAEEIIKEIQFHFDRLLGRKNLSVVVKNQADGSSVMCRPFDYRVIRGSKVTESIKCGELGNVQVNLWVSNTPVQDQSCYFVSSGRRISEISDIKSFMKASVARWSVWNHPNLVGYIEVGQVLEPVITRDEFRRTSARAKVYKTVIKEVEPVLSELIGNANKKRRVLEMGKLGSIISKCFNVAIRKESQRENLGKSYFDSAREGQKTRGTKRSLEALEAEERLALSADTKTTMEGIAMPAKKKRKTDKQKATKVKGSGKFRMVFVNDLKDSKGEPKRAQLIGDDVYINVQHPDFENRVSWSRKSGKMSISERLCSYLANIAATAYKSNIIQRSKDGLRRYNDCHFRLFDEILDLEFAIEGQLRKYLPAIQREVDGADFEE
jgi:hypothetical protein